MDVLRFEVFGPLRVWNMGAEEVIAGRRERTLLAALLLTPDEPVEVERLVVLIWPANQPRDVSHALRTHVMRLRHHLGRDVIRTTARSYSIGVSAETVDAHRFQAFATAGTAHTWARDVDAAEAALAAALDVWRHGEPWIDLAGTGAGDAERAALREERCGVEERLAAIRLRRREAPLEVIERLAIESPLRELRWLLLMHALFVAGQQSRAL